MWENFSTLFLTAAKGLKGANLAKTLELILFNSGSVDYWTGR